MELFDELIEHYRVDPDRRGEAHVACPNCGKPAEHGQVHFSFSPQGAHCFVCGWSGSLATLAAKANLTVNGSAPRPVARPIVAPPWQLDGIGLVTRAMAHPARDVAWAAYKPLTPETLNRWRFGYGKLPFQRPNGTWYQSARDWLIVPLYEDNRLVGLRGRNTSNVGPKWISASGTHYALWGIERLPEYAESVLVCENYVDAAWYMQVMQRPALALGGASNWRPAWTDLLAQKQPRLVIVALDNDLAGQASGRTYDALRRDWRAEHPDLTTIPQPNGPRIANALREAGLLTVLFHWPDDAPLHADIGWMLRLDQERG